jgi:hypothetical protein
MDAHFYYGALRRTIIQFADIFNNIKIAKYDAQGQITKYITVPVKYATKEKMYHDVVDPNKTRPLPLISISLFAINHDNMRIGNRKQCITIDKTFETGTQRTYLAPVPYNLDFQVSIVGKHMVEVDQILEQILAYFNPYVFMRIALTEIPGHTFDVKVLYTSATPDTPTDLGKQDLRIVGWTLYFTAYSYIYTPVDPDGDLIKKIIVKYYDNEDDFTHYGTETMFTSAGSGSYEREATFLKAIGYVDNEVEVEDEYFSVEDYQ